VKVEEAISAVTSSQLPEKTKDYVNKEADGGAELVISTAELSLFICPAWISSRRV
jgi:hypothetical protein